VNSKQLQKVSGARKLPMPEFISPQLATLQDKPPEGDQWFHELKFDGYRMLCHVDSTRVRFWSRSQKDWTHKFPYLSRAVRDFPGTNVILDGEVVAVDSKGRASFQKLQQAMKTGDAGFIFHVFDLLYIDGFNLTKTPLRERKRVLAELFEKVPKKSPLRFSDHIEGNGDAFFKQACE